MKSFFLILCAVVLVLPAVSLAGDCHGNLGVIAPPPAPADCAPSLSLKAPAAQAFTTQLVPETTFQTIERDVVTMVPQVTKQSVQVPVTNFKAVQVPVAVSAPIALACCERPTLGERLSARFGTRQVTKTVSSNSAVAVSPAPVLATPSPVCVCQPRARLLGGALSRGSTETTTRTVTKTKTKL